VFWVLNITLRSRSHCAIAAGKDTNSAALTASDLQAIKDKRASPVVQEQFKALKNPAKGRTQAVRGTRGYMRNERNKLLDVKTAAYWPACPHDARTILGK
jgi:hypothetical protein